MKTPSILIVMGVSGSGKSTVAALLAEHLGWDYLEGDDLHPAANVAKMAAGIALEDQDRWPWLDDIARWISQHVASDQPAVVACSALKRAYRDRLATSGQQYLAFVYLRGGKTEIGARLAARRGHFMSGALLDSQFAVLEPPTADENAITMGIGPSPAELVADVIVRLGLETR